MTSKSDDDRDSFSDLEYWRRKMIIAQHYRPDDPVFNPDDYQE